MLMYFMCYNLYDLDFVQYRDPQNINRFVCGMLFYFFNIYNIHYVLYLDLFTFCHNRWTV